jgi:hypothetical protein
MDYLLHCCGLLWFLIQLSNALRQPKGDGRDVVVRKVLMPGHIGYGNSEFNNVRQAIPSLRIIA